MSVSVSLGNPCGIITLADVSTLRVRFDSDEADVAKIKKSKPLLSPPMLTASRNLRQKSSKSGRNVVDILQKPVRELGTAILLVTHDNRILDIADRILRMEDGKLMQDKKLSVAVEATMPSAESRVV